jgi:hypothetical protein
MIDHNDRSNDSSLATPPSRPGDANPRPKEQDTGRDSGRRNPSSDPNSKDRPRTPTQSEE